MQAGSSDCAGRSGWAGLCTVLSVEPVLGLRSLWSLCTENKMRSCVVFLALVIAVGLVHAYGKYIIHDNEPFKPH